MEKDYRLRPRKRSSRSTSPSSPPSAKRLSPPDKEVTISEITTVHQKISWIVEDDWEDIAKYAELVSGVRRSPESWRAHWKGKALKNLIGGYVD